MPISASNKDSNWENVFQDIPPNNESQYFLIDKSLAIRIHRMSAEKIYLDFTTVSHSSDLCQKKPPSALVALVVGAAQLQVLVVLGLLQLQLRRHLVGAAEVARLAVFLLLLGIRFLPAAKRTPSSWARQGNGLLPANVTLFNGSFL